MSYTNHEKEDYKEILRFSTWNQKELVEFFNSNEIFKKISSAVGTVGVEENAFKTI